MNGIFILVLRNYEKLEEFFDIKVEHYILYKLEKYKDLFDQHEFGEMEEKKINKKKTLLESVGIDQETLDTYMSFTYLDTE